MLAVMILFMGISLWQNYQNQKIITMTWKREVNNLPDLSEEVFNSKNLPEKNEIKDNFDLSFMPEIVEAAIKSNELNPNDNMFHVLKLMVHSTANNEGGAVLYKFNTNLDINGDGLVDFLYHKHSRQREYFTSGNSSYVNNCNVYDFRVYLNNGTGFDQDYYCLYREDCRNASTYRYKGDCADPTG